MIDAGATQVRALVCTSHGAVLGHGIAGPGNTFAVGQKAALRNLEHAVRAAIVSARVSAREIVVAVAGSASVDHPRRGAAPIEAALRRSLPRARVSAVADALIAREGAFAGGPGVVVVSGTGSVVLARGPGGRVVKVGGWGPLLGDEGSAQWVGRQALEAAARAADRRGSPTGLLAALERHFHISSFDRILDVVYDHPLAPAELGALAPTVTRLAARGDVVSRAICRRAGEALAEQAARAIRCLRLRQPRISYQGSLFRAGPLLLQPFCRHLQKLVPRASVLEPRLPPLGGAFLLALEEIGIRPTGWVLAAFRRNCHA